VHGLNYHFQLLTATENVRQIALIPEDGVYALQSSGTIAAFVCRTLIIQA